MYSFKKRFNLFQICVIVMPGKDKPVLAEIPFVRNLQFIPRGPNAAWAEKKVKPNLSEVQLMITS